MNQYVRSIYERASKEDARALFNLGAYSLDGKSGPPKDHLKAIDCFIRAIELGSREVCSKIVLCFHDGNGVAKDMNRVILFSRVGALRGDINARHNIGILEYQVLGNHDVAIRHWKISAEGGNQMSIEWLNRIFNADGKMPGIESISKEDMDNIYRAGHTAQEEIKSEEREKYVREEDKFKC